MHRALAWLTDGRVRLILLLGLLAALVVYVLATRTEALNTASGTAGASASTAVGCPAQSAPSVETVSRTTLRGLHEDLRGVMFDRRRRLYEQGVVASSNAWSDDQPGTRMSLPSGPRDPGGYELRWWAANRDDVVADVFVFADSSQAHTFFKRASSTRCRPSSIALATSSPPGGRDLAWSNPDRFAQEDVYLLRGAHVYRVSVVRAGAGRSTTPAGRSAAFSLVNGLACALPGAGCRQQNDQALAQQTLAEQLTLLRRQYPGSETRGHAGDLGACANASKADGGGTGSAVSESLYYSDALELRIGVRVHPSDAAARQALAHYAIPAALSCLARYLASALRERHAHPSPPRERFASAPLGQGALVSEVEVPFSYRGRSSMWALDDVIVREGRIIDGLSVLAPATNIRSDEHLARELAQITARKLGQPTYTHIGSLQYPP